MKKLKRMLAVLLAAVLTAGIMHTVPAEAATKPSMSLKKRTIYVGGSPVYAETSTYRQGSYTLKVKNRPAKYTITWVSSDESVATVEKNKYKGIVTAIAPGKATITAQVIDRTTSPNTLYTLKCSIIVKANCAAVDIVPASLPELKVGESKNLTGKMYNAAAKEVTKGVEVTDTVKWISSDTSVATVSSKGVVTAVGAGTATITCYTVQSTSGTYSKFAKATAKDTITINVIEPEKPAMIEAKQLSLKSFKLTFGEDYSKLVTKDNLQVTRLGSTVEIDKIEFDAGGTSATVTVTNEMVASTAYKVTLSNVEAKLGTEISFTSSDGKPASMKLHTALSGNRVIASTISDIGFTLYDINGVDITPTNKNSSTYSTYASRIKCSTTNNNLAYCDRLTVWILEVGSAINVIGVYDDGRGNSFSASTVITAVSEASTMTFAGATINSTSKTGAQLDWANPNYKISKSDANYNNKIVARVMKADGTYIYSDDAGSKITFDFPDGYASTIMFFVKGAVYPLAEGSETVLVKYDGVIIGSMSILIGPERMPVSIDAYVNGEKANLAKMSDSSWVSRSNPEISLKITDNYGDIYPLTNTFGLSIDANDSVTPVYVYAGTPESDGNIPLTTVITSNAGAATGKPYSFVVQYDIGTYKLTTSFTILVYKPVEAMSSSYRPTLSGNTDMVIDNNFDTVNGKSLTLTFTELKGEIPYRDCVLRDPGLAGIGDYYALIKDSKGNDAKDADGYNLASSLNFDGTLNIKAVTVQGNTIKKMLPGTYTVMIFKKGTSATDPRVGSLTFTLTDSQQGATCERVSSTTYMMLTKTSGQSELDYVFRECFKVRSGNTELSASVNLNTAERLDGAVFIRDVIVNDSITLGSETFYYTYPLTVNLPVSYKAP